MKILWFWADLSERELNTSLQRVIWPAEAMHDAGHECRVANIPELFREELIPAVQESILWADVIVIERLFITAVNNRIKEMRAMGKKVFATWDDNYALMPYEPKNPNAVNPFEIWRGGKDAVGGRGSILNQFREGIGLCTGALVPSKLLMEDYSAYQPNMFYVPNFPVKKMWVDLPKPRTDIIVAGYGGTSHHNVSMTGSGIIPALGSLSRTYPKFYTHLQTPFPDVVKQFDKLGVRYSLGNWQKIEDWCKTLATFHIGLCPLSGAYDSRRSSLKAIDYAMAGVPWIGTGDAPYKEAKGGILVSNTIKSWLRAIEALINDVPYRNKLAQEGKAWAEALAEECVPLYERIFNG